MGGEELAEDNGTKMLNMLFNKINKKIHIELLNRNKSNFFSHPIIDSKLS